MSLNSVERQNTINELHQNFDLLHQPYQKMSEDLKITSQQIDSILNLIDVQPEDPWIIRNYMNELLDEQGITPVKYSKLTGDFHDYWFLNQDAIENQRLSIN